MALRNPSRTDPLLETRHWLLAAAFVWAGLSLFSPLRSTMAAEHQAASPTLGTPAPQTSPPTATGAHANAAGEATLAASR